MQSGPKTGSGIFGLASGGLAVLRDRKVMMHSPPDDWQGRPVLSIMRAPTMARCGPRRRARVLSFPGGNWSHFSPANQFVWSVF